MNRDSGGINFNFTGGDIEGDLSVISGATSNDLPDWLVKEIKKN